MPEIRVARSDFLIRGRGAIEQVPGVIVEETVLDNRAAQLLGSLDILFLAVLVGTGGNKKMKPVLSDGNPLKNIAKTLKIAIGKLADGFGKEIDIRFQLSALCQRFDSVCPEKDHPVMIPLLELIVPGNQVYAGVPDGDAGLVPLLQYTDQRPKVQHGSTADGGDRNLPLEWIPLQQRYDT